MSSLIAITFAACSNFDSRFARESHAVRKNDAYSGTYEGRWTSSSHPGTGGKLWCILSRQGESEYLAQFKATWHGIFSSTHAVALRTKRASAKSGEVTFAGTAAIKMFVGAGTYRCEGRMDGRQMRACYDATYDRGTFDLSRAGAAERMTNDE